jgi:hypothetical protein
MVWIEVFAVCGSHLDQRASVTTHALYSLGVEGPLGLFAALKRHANVPLFGYEYARKKDLLQLQLHGVGQLRVAHARKLAHAIKRVMKLLLLLLMLLVMMMMMMMNVCFRQHKNEHAICVAVHNAQLWRLLRSTR